MRSPSSTTCKEIRSSSRDGLAVIRVEFDWSKDADNKYDEVVREVNALRAELPQTCANRDPQGQPGAGQHRADRADRPRRSALALKRTTEDLEEPIETVPGIRRAEPGPSRNPRCGWRSTCRGSRSSDSTSAR